MQTDRIQSFARRLVVGMVLVSLVAYFLAVAGYFFLQLGATWFSFTDRLFSLGNYRFMVGLPVSAVAAAGIVIVFQQVAPPKKDGDNLSFEAFGAKFSGPAVPATLWIVTYLALVVSIYAISRADQPPEQQKQLEAPSTAPKAKK
jgi:uncharacterized membrane protein